MSWGLKISLDLKEGVVGEESCRESDDGLRSILRGFGEFGEMGHEIFFGN